MSPRVILLVLNVLALITALGICTTAGSANKIETYADSGQSINISANQESIVAIDSNLTIGNS
ncbi:hypothetical protein ES708_01437 [subsurface metagenome]